MSLDNLLRFADVPTVWRILTQGLLPGEIKKCKTKVDSGFELDDLVSSIECLKPDEYIVIPESSFPWPMLQIDGRWSRAANRSFKRFGSVFNLMRPSDSFDSLDSERKTSVITKGDMGEHLLGPQTLMSIAVDDVLYDDKQKISFNPANFNRLARRGFYFSEGSLNKFLLPQDDLLIGWRLASVILLHHLPFKYSNPKNGFYIHLKSISGGYDSVPARITINGLAASSDSWSNFYDWNKLRFRITKDNSESDIYRGRPEKQDEIGLDVINHQKVASLVLRNYVVNSKNRLYGPVRDHPILPVRLNVSIPPKESSIVFDLRLCNNVIVESEIKKGRNSGKKVYRNLLEGERELLWSGHLWSTGFLDCYRIDEPLSTLRQVVLDYKEQFSKSGFEKIMPPNLVFFGG